MFTFARYHPSGYEVSSKGDKRFSALYAILPGGLRIEEHYQLYVKGYIAQGTDWRLGKGKPPLNGLSREALWRAYKGLWQLWAEENPELLEELRVRASEKGGVLTDMFANGPISQARALAEILNETAHS